MKGRIRLLLLVALLVLGAAGCVQTVYATGTQTQSTYAKKKTGWVSDGKYSYYYTKAGKMTTGWLKLNNKYYYFRKQQSGYAPKGSMVTGFLRLSASKKYFFFNSKGVLQTGWRKYGGRVYYFEKSGKAGTIGTMYTGIRTVGKNKYIFSANGVAKTGLQTYGGKTYYLSTNSRLGYCGRVLTGWLKIDGQLCYFNKNGVMQKNCWINKTYYVDSEGHMLRSCVTPDGYIVNASGKKTKAAKGWIKKGDNYYYYVSRKKVTGWRKINGKLYYFDTDGVRQEGWLDKNGWRYYLLNGAMQTGWLTVDGNRYYFDIHGRLQTNTIVDGITIGADGVADLSSKKTSILIVAGHGQGDCGATAEYGGTTFYEEKFTRQFATLIYNKLKAGAGSNLSITMYDQNYDLYKVNVNYTKYDTVVGPIPDLKSYDYILEIHFNATVESSKDLKGDGVYKGVGMYVNSAKPNVTLDAQIVRAVADTGFKVWGGSTGIQKSSTLFNAKTCQSLGVSYGLLETAFIDDKDDMQYYCNNRDKMAQAVANAILSYFA